MTATSFGSLEAALGARTGRRHPNWRGCPICKKANAGVVMIGIEEPATSANRKRLATRSIALCEEHALALFQRLEAALETVRSRR